MKKSTAIILLLLFGCILGLSGIWIYFQKSLDKVDSTDLGGKACKRHYVLIAEEENSVLWQEIEKSAREKADEADAYLEIINPQTGFGYGQADNLRISIASKVDGIILKPDGSSEVTELINEAAKAGIPVVTILEDDSSSQRISFVGINSYQMGDTYTGEILKSLEEGTNMEVLVLMKSESRDSGTNLIYSQILRGLEEQKKENQVQISAYSIKDSTDFDEEEAVRNLFLNRSSLPDILICMDEVITECAYQALLEYNELGNVKIIGYYTSEAILDAVKKGNILETISMDSEDIGTYSINALEEYHSLGRASSYYSVGLNIITQENVDDYEEKYHTDL